MFEMVAGFEDTRVAGLDLMCVVTVTGIVGEISQGFAKLDTSGDNVHTGTCKRKHEHLINCLVFANLMVGWLVD